MSHLAGEEHGEAVPVQLVAGPGVEVGGGGEVGGGRVQDVGGRAAGPDHPHPSHVHPHAVRHAVPVIVLQQDASHVTRDT